MLLNLLLSGMSIPSVVIGIPLYTTNSTTNSTHFFFKNLYIQLGVGGNIVNLFPYRIFFLCFIQDHQDIMGQIF